RGDRGRRARTGAASSAAPGGGPGDGRHQRRAPARGRCAGGAAHAAAAAGHGDHPQPARGRTAAGPPDHRPRRDGRGGPCTAHAWRPRRAAEGRSPARQRRRGRYPGRCGRRAAHRASAPAGRGAWHRLHPGLGRGRQPRAGPVAAPGLQRCDRLRACRAARRLAPGPRRRAGAGPLRLPARSMSQSRTSEQSVSASDAHRWTLASVAPAEPRARLLWLPALGVAARHYLPLAEALAGLGIAVHLHEWRGNGSSSLRPSRAQDWGYAELLTRDLPASLAAIPNNVPTWIGGHSLGGQLACCFAGLQPARIAGLALVASGTPYWKTFPTPLRWLLPLAYRLLPWLARRQGVLHGRHLGFGGTEAHSLIADWAAVGRSGRYAAAGTDVDLEAGMAAL